MKDITGKINELIQEQAASGVFTADVIKQMHAISEESIALKKSNDEIRLLVDGANKMNDTLLADNNKLTDQVAAFRKREKELGDRERKMTVLELTAEHEAKRVQDHINMVGLVFRNTEVRKEMYGTTPAGVDQYGSQVSASTSESTTEKVE